MSDLSEPITEVIRSKDGTDHDVLLTLDNVSVGFEAQSVLRGISFELPRVGCVGILGPGGVGKSTLLRTLARLNEVLPSFWLHGRIDLEGRDFIDDVEIHEARRLVPLLAQKASLTTATVLDNAIAGMRGAGPLDPEAKRELARGALEPFEMWEEYEPLLDAPVLNLSIGQMRRLAVARLVAPGALCLLADEPLRDLPPRQAARMEALLSRLATTRCVLLITHDQRAARRLCDKICLVTAGRVAEFGAMDEFFSAPKTRLGADFVENGNCWPVAGELEPAAPVNNWTPSELERRRTPRSFHWVLSGLLGGTQWPGLLGDEHGELAALARLGCRHLVSLTEIAFPQERLEGHGIGGLHFPIVDMRVPKPEEMLSLCQTISEWVDQGTPSVVHCRAGLGRTGTVLACVLIYRGENAVGAVERIRAINRYYIQSNEQGEFVSMFEAYVAECAGGGRAA